MAVLAGLVLAACGGGFGGGFGGLPVLGSIGPSGEGDAAAGLLENRVWRETTPGAAPGAFAAFLADGTLITGSCAALYRLAAWRRIDGATLAWSEDTGAVRAEIALLGPDEMVLVPETPGGQVRSFRRAVAPGGC